MMGKGGSKSTTVVQSSPEATAASKEAIQLGREQFSWMKNEISPEMMGLTRRVVDQQIAAAGSDAAKSAQQWTQYLSQFRPVEDRVLLDSLGFSDMSDEDARALVQSTGNYQRRVLADQRARQLSDINDRAMTGTARTATENVTENRTVQEPILQAVGGGGWNVWTGEQRPAIQQIVGYKTREEPVTRTVTRQVGGLPAEHFEAERAEAERAYQAGMSDLDARGALLLATRNGEQQAMETQAARNRAEVLKNAQFAQEAADREAMRMGIRPDSGAYLSRRDNALVAQAGAEADAMNRAREAVRARGMESRQGVVNFGRGFPNTALAASAASLSAGNSAVGNLNQTVATNVAGRDAARGWWQTGISGLAPNTTQTTKSGGGSGIFGELAGKVVDFGLGKIFGLSAEELKENRNRPDRRALIDMVKDTSTDTWKYKPGVSDDARHIGPMAGEMKRRFGIGDGVSLPLQDVAGLSLAATRAGLIEMDGLKDLIRRVASKVDRMKERA